MKAQNKQSIFDLSGQYFGDLNHIVSLAVGNDLTLNQEIPINQELIINNPVGVGNDKNKEAIVVQGLSFNNDAIAIYGYDFSRWFLPSKDELNKMYEELALYSVGGFDTGGYGVYISSTENSATSFWGQTLAGGGLGTQQTLSKSNGYSYRACRKFTAAVGAYSLRDVGPAGGLIFYINGNTYLECQPDTAGDDPTSTWSNITNVSIGTTSSDIGEGQNNTNEIIAQTGHTDSAAKLCDDLN